MNNISTLKTNLSDFISGSEFSFYSLDLEHKQFRVRQWEVKVEVKGCLATHKQKVYYDLSMEKLDLFTTILNNVIFAINFDDLDTFDFHNNKFVGIYGYENRMLDVERAYLIYKKMTNLVHDSLDIIRFSLKDYTSEISTEIILDKNMLESYNFPKTSDSYFLKEGYKFLYDEPWWFKDNLDIFHPTCPEEMSFEEAEDQYSSGPSLRRMEAKFLRDNEVNKYDKPESSNKNGDVVVSLNDRIKDNEN